MNFLTNMMIKFLIEMENFPAVFAFFCLLLLLLLEINSFKSYKKIIITEYRVLIDNMIL